MKKLAIVALAISTAFVSCKKELPDVGATSAQKVANEWWVTMKDASGADLAGVFKLSTYNTSANNGDIWVDDLEHSWQFKVKAQVDYNNLTFKAANQGNEYYPITVTINDGKVLLNAAKSKTGNTTDSIYFKVEFSDDPGSIYTISGHARTKFAEDEY
jgi:hypothetical protein